MTARTTTIEVTAPERYAYRDITEELDRAIKDSGVTDGAAIVFCAHTTCALLINEWEDGAMADFRTRMRDLVPDEGLYYAHDDLSIRTENLVEDEPANAPAHILHAVAGKASESITIVAGRLQLGEGQRVLFVELDSSRLRHYLIQVLGE